MFKKKGTGNFTHQDTSGGNGPIDMGEYRDNGLNKVSLLAWLAFAVLVAVFIFSNAVYTLSDQQQAVVTTFGKPSIVTKLGWNWKLPVIQKVTTVPKSISGMPIGYVNSEDGQKQNVAEESLMITSDFNFVNVEFYLTYGVSDPIQAVIHADVYKDIIKNLAQSYIRDTVGVHTIDDVMTTGKAEIEATVDTKLRERLVEENIGYYIDHISLQDVSLPLTSDGSNIVARAFEDVEAAKQGMETSINEANKYNSEKLPEAIAQADKIKQEAEAYKAQRINEGIGQASRFEDLYSEYMKYPLITKKRMFYETMETVLPKLKVIINSSDGVQTMLPLETFNSTVVNQAPTETAQ